MLNIENSVYLTRVVDNKQRYLKIHYTKTLFDNIFLVTVVFGATRNLKPTGVKKYYFATYDDMIKYFKQYIKSKRAKGYG